MPPKKKKQPKNAFYFFMMDWKAEKEEQGQRFANLKEVSDLCNEDWEHLPEYNKRHYKELEKEAKLKDKDDRSNKFNSLGVTFEEIDKKAREEEVALNRMEDEIEQTMRTLLASEELLINHCFFLVHANVYCYWGHKQLYIPCEVAISKFNLKEGLIDTHHVFPAPFTKNGDLPLGYKFEARTNAENVHSIPEPSEFDLLERDWSKIRDGVRQFLRPNGGKDLPPLFTMDGDDANTNCYLSAVKTFFDDIANDSDDEFRVYSLPLLFFKLYNTCQQVAERLYDDNEVAFPVVGLARQQLMKDVYNFSRGIACNFHEETDHLHNCSLSFVKRWVYLISEFCVKALRIEVIPGHHCLSNAKVELFSKPKTYNHEVQPVSKKSAPTRQPQPVSPKNYQPAAAAAVAAVSVDGNREDAGEGAWSTVQHKMKNMSVKSDQTAARSDGFTYLDYSAASDPSKTRVLKTGQSQNVVSVSMPEEKSIRLPTTRGRGEMLIRALSQQNSAPGASFSSDDFPAIGAGKPSAPGRLAKPISSGWGRGFLQQQ